ncbi:hypothetical protein LTS18_000571, partial [Coniosporium uncinatum]
VAPKTRGQDVRHFGWGDDVVEDSPVKRPVVHQARPDSKAHFDFVDDGTPMHDRKLSNGHRGRAQNEGQSLYKDHVLGNDDVDVKKPLATVTNVHNQHRHKDFDSQFAFDDKSPAANKTKNPFEETSNVPQKKVISSMDAHWGLYDENPNGAKENRGISIKGDGMGSRKVPGEEHWWDF